jgi:hypothetical protein
MKATKTTKTTHFNYSITRKDIEEYYKEFLVVSDSSFKNINLDKFATAYSIVYLAKHFTEPTFLEYILPEALHMDNKTFSIYRLWWLLGTTDEFCY